MKIRSDCGFANNPHVVTSGLSLAKLLEQRAAVMDKIIAGFGPAVAHSQDEARGALARLQESIRTLRETRSSLSPLGEAVAAMCRGTDTFLESLPKIVNQNEPASRTWSSSFVSAQPASGASAPSTDHAAGH